MYARALFIQTNSSRRRMTPCHTNTVAPANETTANAYANRLMRAKNARWYANATHVHSKPRIADTTTPDHCPRQNTNPVAASARPVSNTWEGQTDWLYSRKTAKNSSAVKGRGMSVVKSAMRAPTITCLTRFRSPARGDRHRPSHRFRRCALRAAHAMP